MATSPSRLRGGPGGRRRLRGRRERRGRRAVRRVTGAPRSGQRHRLPRQQAFRHHAGGSGCDEVASALNIYAGGGGAASAGAGKDGAALALRGGFGGDGATGLAPGDGARSTSRAARRRDQRHRALQRRGHQPERRRRKRRSDGSINLGVTTAKAINSGSGSTPWTHAGPPMRCSMGETNANTSITAADSMNGKCILLHGGYRGDLHRR